MIKSLKEILLTEVEEEGVEDILENDPLDLEDHYPLCLSIASYHVATDSHQAAILGIVPIEHFLS